jgi:hypothetical protein
VTVLGSLLGQGGHRTDGLLRLVGVLSAQVRDDPLGVDYVVTQSADQNLVVSQHGEELHVSGCSNWSCHRSGRRRVWGEGSTRSKPVMDDQPYDQ